MTYLDHSHCWESSNPPCGQKIKHFECCLCKKENPEISAAKSHTIPDDLRAEFEKDFRARLIELDDFNSHMFNVHEPIKGDIYFDGIEMEAFCLQFVADREAKAREEMEKLFDKIEALDLSTMTYGEFRRRVLALLTPSSKPE